FVKDHDQVRPWLLGIGLTFTAAGGVFSLGPGFVTDVLGGGKTGFGFLVGFLATGMILGLLASGLLVRVVQKDVLFSSCLVLLGSSFIALASMGSLNTAIPIAGALGFFGGAGYSTAYSLLQENTADELRGRTFSAAYTIIRIGTLFGLGIFPFLAGAFGDHEIGSYPLPGTRMTFWLAGALVVVGGLFSMRAIRANRAERAAHPPRRRGFFVAFEGGEGAGKTTQMDALVERLRARGEEVVTTREPGGTEIGERIRDLLLDPANRVMDARAEALLYAADRAQHVAEVVRPALDAGKVVVSDRFVDSSLAYQGLARGLGLDEVYEISKWAIDGELPDLVIYLEVPPGVGLERKESAPDRLELESDGFHERVFEAYRELASRFPERFVVVDATRPKAAVHQEVLEAYDRRISERSADAQLLPSPGAPVVR
ncbi:MAG: dTMP kinase, partial [Actinomycetota bacterium]